MKSILFLSFLCSFGLLSAESLDGYVKRTLAGAKNGKKAIFNMNEPSVPEVKSRSLEKEDPLGEELIRAVSEGDLNKVKSLVGRGANVNYGRRSGRCFKGATPLWEATNQYKYEIASYLVSKGADVNKQDDYGWTPLYLTAQKGPWTLLNYY